MNKILIIGKKEDNAPSIQSTINERFPACKIHLGLPGKEGMVQASNEKPDAILIHSTAKESLELCAKFKTKESTNTIPIILLTPSGLSSPNRQKFMDAGVDAFISSPPEPVELTALLNMLWKMKTTKDKLDEVVLTRTDLLKESEEKNKLLIENAPYCIHQIDTDGKLMSVNQAGLAMLDVQDESEVINCPYIDTVCSEDKPKIEEFLKKALQGTSSFFEFTSKNNKVFSSSFIPIFDENGKILRLVGITIDITQKRKDEEKLKNQEMMLRKITQNIPNTYLSVIENDFTIGFTAGMEFKKSKLDPAQFIGMTLEQVYGDQTPFVIENYKKSFEGEVGNFQMIFNNQIQAYRTVPLPNEDGSIHRILSFVENITERKKTEETIKKQNDFLNTVIESLTHPFYVIDANNYKIKMAHSATGLILKHKNITCHMITHGNENPCQDPEHPCPLKIIKRTKKPVIVQHFHYDQNNNLRNIEVHGYPVISKEGEVEQIIEYCLDVTEQKRTEKIQRVLYNISNAVNSTDSLENLIGRIHEEVETILDTTNFYIALYDAEANTIVSPYYTDEKDHFKTFPTGKTLTKYVIDTQKPLLANLDKKKELMAQGKIETYGSLSKIWLGIPLKIDGEVIGVVAVQSYTNEEAFNASDMKILEFVSNQISISIDRKRAEDELKLHREHLEELVKERTTELQEKNAELERFNNLFIGREFRIKELRDKVKELEKKITE